MQGRRGGPSAMYISHILAALRDWRCGRKNRRRRERASGEETGKGASRWRGRGLSLDVAVGMVRKEEDADAFLCKRERERERGGGEGERERERDNYAPFIDEKPPPSYTSRVPCGMRRIRRRKNCWDAPSKSDLCIMYHFSGGKKSSPS